MKLPEINTAAAAAILRVLGNETRLQIVLRLLRGEAAVSELERELGIRQPNLSQHLGELRDAGLVVGRREAKSVIYSLASASQERLVTALSYGFGGPGHPPQPQTGCEGLDKRRGHLGAVFARVTTDE